MNCPYCGAELQGSVCPSCGADLRQTAGETTVLNQQGVGETTVLNQQGFGETTDLSGQQPVQQAWQQPYPQPAQQSYPQPMQQPYQQPMQQPYPQPMQQPYAPAAQPAAGPQEPGAVRHVRRLGRSVLYLIGALALTTQFVFFVLQNLAAFRELKTLADALGLEFTELMTSQIPVLIVGAVFFLIVFSVWITFFAALHKGVRRMTTSGVGTIGVIAAGALGIAILVFPASFLYFIYLLVDSGMDTALGKIRELIGETVWSYAVSLLGIPADGGEAFDMILILYAALCAVSIVFFACLYNTTKTVAATIKTGTPDSGVSLVTALFCFLFAGGFVWLCIPFVQAKDWLGAAPCAAGALSNLCFGLLLVRWRFAMRRTDAY